MEFLVRLAARLPEDMAQDQRKELLQREAARGRELIDLGVIARIWRVPGRQANVGVWNAADATALHDAITSLPLAPFFVDVSVEPLALHPLEAR